ncbi:MAG: repeat-containing protein [Planctomycetota bacterium]|nr:repeat-containing protein [Planctomycetota bacterium]
MQLESALRAGESLRAEDMIAAHPGLTSDTEAVLELIYSEFVIREELGQDPSPEAWYARFPEWQADLEQMFQLHQQLRLAEASRPQWSPGRVRSSGHPARQGDRIADYELFGELGRGGMGVVYKARQIRLNRVVALKLILSGDLAGKKERDRFQREVEAAARLDHPNIVRIFEVGEHEGRPFCSMEYVGGGNLADRITGVPWPARSAAELIALLARAAHHAHERGVIHRDLKPANILLVGEHTDSDDGKARATLARRDSLEPKIADFGLAKCLTGEGNGPTRTGDFLVGLSPIKRSLT